MEQLRDIVFYHGKLYGLTRGGEKLFKFDIGINEEGAPVFTASHLLNVHWSGSPRIKSVFLGDAYIFGLQGKLAMAVMAQWMRNHKPFFKVFKLTVTADDAHDYKWEEMSNLGDCALFLGRTCSSSVVRVQADMRGGVDKNHIYYFNHYLLASKEHQEFDEKAYLTRSAHGDRVCCWEDPKSHYGGDGVERIPSTGYYIMSGSTFPMWCFTPDFRMLFGSKDLH